MDHQQSNDVVPSRTQLVTRARERRYDATTRFFCPERECERATRPFDRYNNLKQVHTAVSPAVTVSLMPRLLLFLSL